MTTTEILTPTASSSDANVDTGLKVCFLAELITKALCGLHEVNGYFLRTSATLGVEGIITLEVTRVYFDGDDATVYIALHPTATGPHHPNSRRHLPDPGLAQSPQHSVDSDTNDTAPTRQPLDDIRPSIS